MKKKVKIKRNPDGTWGKIIMPIRKGTPVAIRDRRNGEDKLILLTVIEVDAITGCSVIGVPLDAPDVEYKEKLLSILTEGEISFLFQSGLQLIAEAYGKMEAYLALREDIPANECLDMISSINSSFDMMTYMAEKQINIRGCFEILREAYVVIRDQIYIKGTNKSA